MLHSGKLRGLELELSGWKRPVSSAPVAESANSSRRGLRDRIQGTESREQKLKLGRAILQIAPNLYKTCIIGTASGGVFAMRMMLKVSIPVESGNAAIRNGSLGATITRILDELKPEAAYFAEDNGQRTGYIFFDMKDASQLPAIAEPWFLAFNASLTVRPAMNQQDLVASSGGMERAVKGYGKAAA